MNIRLLKTTLGYCGVVSDNDAIKEVILPSSAKTQVIKRLKYYPMNPVRKPNREIISFIRQLNRYFSGEKVDLRCKIDLRNRSDFEKAVYKTVRTIPYGMIQTYKWVAEKVGCPKGSRAVGNALAKNSLPLIIPCHRVVRSDGSLGGFSAIGGLKLKEKLLKLEKGNYKTCH